MNKNMRKIFGFFNRKISHASENISHTQQEIAEIKDYISLLKPRVMSLVVFTGLCGMLLANNGMHPFILVIAIICICLGSGASGAINMWLERESDKLMKRTQNRPLPQNRLNAQNALEFAGVLAFISVLLMAFAVNILAAGLLLLAILYYVFVYTIWLKPRTPQNIVIGGAAGAFPPMIGWASATGEISAISVTLFLIIFFWTPPHFWALAIHRNSDYTNAKIPMLPVVKGVAHTKMQILIYSLILVPLTLVPYFIGFSGYLYLAVATMLGVVFIAKAVQLFKNPDEKNCMGLFKYSILYLFVIFFSIVVDNFI